MTGALWEKLGDLNEITPATLAGLTDTERDDLSQSLAWASVLANVLCLQGVSAGSGDVLDALRLTGTVLRGDADPSGGYGRFFDPRPVMDEITETRDCPKCGEVQTRLKGIDRYGWWHEREGWGYQRKCGPS